MTTAALTGRPMVDRTFVLSGFNLLGEPTADHVTVPRPVPPLYFWLGADAESWRHISEIRAAPGRILEY